MATSRGMDVSAYQGVQDWAALRANGVTFVFAKASEGERSRDARFDVHIAGIIKAGLVPGAYHFAWPVQDVAKEAANYIAAVRPYARRGFVHWLDLEAYSDGRNYGSRSAAQIRAWVSEWLRLVAAAFPGQRCGVYTSADDIAQGHLPAGVPLWFPRYPWGAADWARAEATAQTLVHGRSVLFWQFTSQPYDRSIAYLSEAALRAWAAGDSSEEDEMQLSDQIKLGDWIPKYWPKDQGLQDRKLPVDVALGSGYAHSRKAAENTVKILAQLGAQQATIDKLVDALAAGGGLTAAEIKAAAEAGAQAALAELGDKLQQEG